MSAPVPPGLRIVLVDDDESVHDHVGGLLREQGYDVVGQARSGAEAIALCRSLVPDLVIMDVKMPGMDGVEAARQIGAERRVPILILTAYHEEEIVRRAGSENVLAYLVKPVREEALGPAIEVAMARARQMALLEREVATLQETLQDRKLIERAKGILMTRNALCEADAHRVLQRIASNRRRKMAEVAEEVLANETMQQEIARESLRGGVPRAGDVAPGD